MKKQTRAFIATLTLATACVTGLMTHDAEAKSLYEMIFGPKEKDVPPDQRPEVTLQAPFIDKEAAKKTNSLTSIYDETRKASNTTINLDQPHRNPDQIVSWATGIVSQAMTVSAKTWDKDTQILSANFLPYALEEYKSYLESVKMVESLGANGLRLQSIANGEGAITKEGVIDGTYHWLIQIPIMATFFKEGTEQIDKNANFQSQNLIIQVQVGRVATKGDNDIGLTVERWHVSGTTE